MGITCRSSVSSSVNLENTIMPLVATFEQQCTQRTAHSLRILHQKMSSPFMQMQANLQLDFKVFFLYTRMKTFYIGKIQLLGLGAGE